MSCSLHLFLLGCWAPLFSAATFDDIFYGNALLDATFLSEPPVITEYNGNTVARFDGHAQVTFDAAPAEHDYTLIVELHALHSINDDDGFCFIVRPGSNHDVRLIPHVATESDECTGGIVQYGEWHSQCLSSMNRLSVMDTIQLVSVGNETLLYVNDELLYVHDDDFDSQFGFGCVSAVAFVRRFEWVIHGLPTVAPQAPKTVSTSSNTENANRTIDVHADSENDTTFFDAIASWKLLFFVVPIAVCCVMLLSGHFVYNRWYTKGEYFAFNDQIAGPLRTVNAVNV